MRFGPLSPGSVIGVWGVDVGGSGVEGLLPGSGDARCLVLNVAGDPVGTAFLAPAMQGRQLCRAGQIELSGAWRWVKEKP